MSSFEVSLKITFPEQFSVEAESVEEAISKAKKEACAQYGLLGDEIEVEEVQEDFI